MWMLRIDISLILLSSLVLLGTFVRNLARTQRESKVFKYISRVTSGIQRQIFMAASAHKEDLSGSQKKTKVQNTKSTTSKKDSFLEIKQRLNRAEVLMKRGHFDEAEKHLVEALSFDKDNRDINKLLALVYLKAAKYPKAELIYLKLAEQGVKDPSVYSNLGLVLYQRGRLDMAIQSYNRAIELEPHKSSRYASIGQIYYELKDVQNAVLHYEKAHKLDRKITDYMFILAKFCEELGRPEKAKHYYHKVLDIEPYNAEAKEAIKKLL